MEINQDTVQDDLARFKGALDGTSSPVMMVDRDLIITYVNKSTVDLMRKNEAVFKAAFPGFSVDKLIGTCIDVFHKNPAHQRRLLSDPANLPRKADIRLGNMAFEIYVSANYDAKGGYVGGTLEWRDVTALRDYMGQLEAISRAQAVVEFNLDGTISSANENFLRTFGYQLDELVGKHHSQFVDPTHARSNEYRQFWRNLSEGKFEAGEYKRLAKGGREVWIHGAYNPIPDASGKPLKVVKYAIDITEQKLKNADYSGQIEAISKSQAVIEFNMDGTVRDANQNFLSTLGYRLEDVVGKHHSMFVEAAHARSSDYREFWQNLNSGRFQSGEFKRIGAGGREVWIQASYNPILDLNGKPFKVVQYASDITQQKHQQIKTEQLIAEAQRVVEALSRGDLTQDMTGDFEGSFAELRDQMNATIQSLQKMVREIEGSASTIGQAATDISEGNSNLNKRTQEQSSALEETAASLEEMTATVKQNAANATQANQLAAGAREAAEKGGQVVGAAVSAMTAITESSKKVADIISVIEQIAFQTNMLALNAAVEAARAGDQGRGFAVVAAEVRNLAQRSAGAAKEIKGLIQDSQEKVEQGAKLVNRSGETLQEIVGSVKKVSDIVGEINAASDEQATGIDQINSAVSQMDKSTQQNAAMVEQAAAAAESMNEQARSLSELIGFFQVEDEQEAPPPPRAVAAAPRNRPPRATRPVPRETRVAKSAAPANGNGKVAARGGKRPTQEEDPDWAEF